MYRVVGAKDDKDKDEDKDEDEEASTRAKSATSGQSAVCSCSPADALPGGVTADDGANVDAADDADVDDDDDDDNDDDDNDNGDVSLALAVVVVVVAIDWRTCASRSPPSHSANNTSTALASSQAARCTNTWATDRYMKYIR